MAWWAEYKRCLCYRKHAYYHWVKWYKKYLYDIWFYNLPKDEQERIKRREEESLANAWAALSIIGSMRGFYRYADSDWRL